MTEPMTDISYALRRLEMHSEFSVLGKGFRKYNSYRYTDFLYRPAGSKSAD